MYLANLVEWPYEFGPGSHPDLLFVFTLRDFFDRFFLAAILTTMFISGCSALGVCVIWMCWNSDNCQFDESVLHIGCICVLSIIL